MFRVLEKRTSFPLSEGCCSRTGMTATWAPSERVFSQAGKLYSEKCDNLFVWIFAFSCLWEWIYNWTWIEVWL